MFCNFLYNFDKVLCKIIVERIKAEFFFLITYWTTLLQTIAEAVGDWYFGRDRTKEIDCAYPCDETCHNLIPSAPNQVKHLISNLFKKKQYTDLHDRPD